MTFLRLSFGTPYGALSPDHGLVERRVVGADSVFVVTGVPGNHVGVVYIHVEPHPGIPPKVHATCLEESTGRAWFNDSIEDGWLTREKPWWARPSCTSRFEFTLLTSVDAVFLYADPAQLPPATRAEGACPRCGSRGFFVRTALCCPEHGAYAGF